MFTRSCISPGEQVAGSKSWNLVSFLLCRGSAWVSVHSHTVPTTVLPPAGESDANEICLVQRLQSSCSYAERTFPSELSA